MAQHVSMRVQPVACFQQSSSTYVSFMFYFKLDFNELLFLTSSISQGVTNKNKMKKC